LKPNTPFAREHIEKGKKVKGPEDHKKFLRGILKDLQEIREVLK